MTPIPLEFLREQRVQRETAPREGIEGAAGAPIEREEAARFARGCACHIRPLDDDNVDPAASQEIRGAGTDDTAAANHYPHALLQRLMAGWIVAIDPAAPLTLALSQEREWGQRTTLERQR